MTADLDNATRDELRAALDHAQACAEALPAVDWEGDAQVCRWLDEQASKMGRGKITPKKKEPTP